MSREQREVGIVVDHIKEWVRGANIGDRKVLLRLPLRGWDRDILARTRGLGLVYQDQGRYLLEKAF